MVRDSEMAEFVWNEVLGAKRGKPNGWFEISGSSDVLEVIKTISEGMLDANEHMCRICRATIESSIAESVGITMEVFGGFSCWRKLYKPNRNDNETDSDKGRTFDYIADHPHEIGSRNLLMTEVRDEVYIKLRNFDRRWYHVDGTIDDPVLHLADKWLDNEALDKDGRKNARIFDSRNVVIKIGKQRK